MSDFRMNSPEGKAILALVRDGDYAHPGEEEAIVLATSRIDRSGIRRILDAGCGRGGTAAWFEQRGWGAVTGVDLDSASIDYARGHYPEVSFLHQDVARLAELGLEPFDLIYLLTSYYAFSDQIQALRQFRSVSRSGGRLLLVDYTQSSETPLPPELGEEIGCPIILGTIGSDLATAGWEIVDKEDWTWRFAGWYESLLNRFEDRRPDIIDHAGPEWYAYVVRWYGALHRALADGRLGGIVLTAVATDVVSAADRR